MSSMFFLKKTYGFAIWWSLLKDNQPLFARDC